MLVSMIQLHVISTRRESQTVLQLISFNLNVLSNISVSMKLIDLLYLYTGILKNNPTFEWITWNEQLLEVQLPTNALSGFQLNVQFLCL